MADVVVELHAQLGPLRLEVATCFAAGLTVLFGPSGSGKTTLLRMIAGLQQPDAGRVLVAGRLVTETGQGLCVPAHRRGVRMLGQRPSLFPVKTVRGNVRFGTTDAARLEEAIRLCRVRDLLDRPVSALSGGERQRVALARTLAADGMSCLLLDEPFTGLDATLRDQLHTELRTWLNRKEIAVVLVTHDVGEALAGGGRVVRLREGRIVAEGAPEEVLGPERELLRRRLQSPMQPG